MIQGVQESQPQSDLIFNWQTVNSLARSAEGLTLGSLLLTLAVLSLLEGKSKKGKLATSYWGSKKQKKQAAQRAKKQIQKPKRNSAALYIGTPPKMQQKLEEEWSATFKKKFKPSRSFTSLYIPDIQRGISVSGAPGSGKTFSVIDPAIRSALDQGLPTIIYDFKYPAQTKRAAAYALKRGYKVRVFAPGFPESEVCNPFDFLKNSEDAIAAGQLAEVINRNIDRSQGKAQTDKFFEDAGDALVQGIFLLTKLVAEKYQYEDYADLMTASAILNLPNLPERLEAAVNKMLIPIWTSRSLSQLISVKDSEKTVAGIIGTAQRVFQHFLKRDFMNAFCGRTTLPLDLEEKEVIFFGLDRTNRDIVAPLVAAIFYRMIVRNVSRPKPRKSPLVVFLDELPTIYLPNLVNLLNESREDGFCGILGFQNLGQLEKTYGKETTRAIIGATATKFIFNPQDPTSAKFFSELLGDTEVSFKSKSRSWGGKGGTSTSRSQQYQKKPLFEPAQFAKLDTGRCVVLSPAFKDGKDSYLPLLEQIRVPQSNQEEQKWSESRWEAYREFLIQQRGKQLTNEEWSAKFQERKYAVEQLFPEGRPGTPAEASSSQNRQGVALPVVNSIEDVAPLEEQLGARF